MKVAFVLEATTVAGGHRNVFSLANQFHARGHEAVVFCVDYADTGWMRVDVPVISAGSYGMLRNMLEEWDGITIATWWKTAAPVAGATHGSNRGFYFIQDIETSYAHDEYYKQQVLGTYAFGLTHFTYGRWIEDEFRRLNLGEITRVGLGYDKTIFYPIEDQKKPATNVILFHERNHFLKGPELRREVLLGLKGKLTTVGFAPWGQNPCADRHLWSCDDTRLASHMRDGLALLVTSIHEGFCLPALEAMACGLPVITTYADGNEEFCVHEENCLMGRTAEELISHAVTLKEDHDLWAHLRNGAIKTAQQYDWDYTVDCLEKLFVT